MKVEIEIIPNSIELVKMSDEIYFSEQYKDYISNSKLSLINEEEGGSEEKFFSGFKSSFSDSFELGSAVHALVLQNDFYFISKCNKPTGKLGVFAEEVLKLRSKGYKIKDAVTEASINADYYAAKFSDTRLKTAIKGSLEYYLNRLRLVEKIEGKTPIYISKPIKEKLNQCLIGISENKKFAEKLKPQGLFEDPQIFNEYAILCEIIVTIDDIPYKVKIKGKLDNFTVDRENCIVVLNDLKTSGKPSKFFMGNYVKEVSESGEEIQRWYDGSMQRYHYYRQFALYLWLLQAALKQYYDIEYKLEANVLVVETIPNFKSAVYKISNKHIQKGLKEFKDLITKVVLCKQKN